MDRKAFLAAAGAIRPWLVELRRGLHRRPELGHEESATADAIGATLDSLGIPYARRETAIVALLEGRAPRGGGGPFPTVALRADIDALPLQESPAREYASRVPGVMHACGHDAHAAIALGAARLLAERRDALRGNVKFLFQPAEETTGGADDMVKAGCLENPRVDRVIGLHVMPYLPVGTVEVKKGALCGSSATLDVVVRGKGAHGAYPETGIDAILIAANVALSLNTLVSRYVSPLEQAVLTIGTIAGGARSNIIADEVRMGATLRTTSDALRETLVARARAVVEGVAAAFGGSGSLEFSPGYAALVNDAGVTDLVAARAADLLGDGAVRWKEKPSMGVEDFSFFIREVRGAFYHLGCGNPERGITAPLHSPDFDIDEDCLPLGAALQAALVLDLIDDCANGGTA